MAVAVGLAATELLLVEVHTTLPPVEVAGKQVVPGMLTLSPDAMLVQVMTVAAVWLDGFGAAVQTGAAGGVLSTTSGFDPVLEVPVGAVTVSTGLLPTAFAVPVQVN